MGIGSANGNRTERLPVQFSLVGSKCLQTRSTGFARMLRNALRNCDVVTRLSLGAPKGTFDRWRGWAGDRPLLPEWAGNRDGSTTCDHLPGQNHLAFQLFLQSLI